MISRRSFLSVLASIPILGKYLNHSAALAAGDAVGRLVHAPRKDRSLRAVYLTESYEYDNAVYARHLREVWANPPAHCVDANPAKTMANMVDEAVSRSMKERYRL